MLPLPIIYVPHPWEIIQHIALTLENRKLMFLSVVQSLFRKFLLPTAILSRIFFSPQNCKLKIFQLIFLLINISLLFEKCFKNASLFKKKIITNVMLESKTLFTLNKFKFLYIEDEEITDKIKQARKIYPGIGHQVLRHLNVSGLLLNSRKRQQKTCEIFLKASWERM